MNLGQIRQLSAADSGDSAIIGGGNFGVDDGQQLGRALGALARRFFLCDAPTKRYWLWR